MKITQKCIDERKNQPSSLVCALFNRRLFLNWYNPCERIVVCTPNSLTTCKYRDKGINVYVCVAWAHGSRKKQPKSGIFRMEIMVEEHRRESHIAKSYGKALSMEMEKRSRASKSNYTKNHNQTKRSGCFFLTGFEEKKTHFVRFGWRAMTHTVKRDFAQNLFVDYFFPPEWEKSNEKQGERERKEEAQQSSNVSSTRNNYVDGISFSPIVPLSWCIWKKSRGSMTYLLLKRQSKYICTHFTIARAREVHTSKSPSYSSTFFIIFFGTYRYISYYYVCSMHWWRRRQRWQNSRHIKIFSTCKHIHTIQWRAATH